MGARARPAAAGSRPDPFVSLLAVDGARVCAPSLEPDHPSRSWVLGLAPSSAASRRCPGARSPSATSTWPTLASTGASACRSPATSTPGRQTPHIRTRRLSVRSNIRRTAATRPERGALRAHRRRPLPRAGVQTWSRDHPGPAAMQAASTATSAATHIAAATRHQILSELRECCFVSANMVLPSLAPGNRICVAEAEHDPLTFR